MQKKIIICDDCGCQIDKPNKLRFFMNKDKKIKLDCCKDCAEGKAADFILKHI